MALMVLLDCQALLALLPVIAFDLIHGGAPRDHSTYVYLLSGALSGFLMFNLQIFNGRRVFLGDSGSMLIGLMIALALIGASPRNKQITRKPQNTAFALLMDFNNTNYRYYSNCNSKTGEWAFPLSPDRTHIHHKIMVGLSARRTL